MGGGPSLPEQMIRVPGAAVRVSANEHGAKFGTVDYVVGVDRHVLKEKGLRDYGAPIIAPHGWADYRIAKQHHPSAGITAAWALWAMGCAPVLLAGMDLYVDSDVFGVYWHDANAKSTGTTTKLGRHVDRWLGLRAACGGVRSPFRALGEPLLAFFPAYDATESVDASHVVEATGSAVGVRIVLERPYEGRNEDRFEPGDEPELAPEHAERLVRGGYARFANDPRLLHGRG